MNSSNPIEIDGKTYDKYSINFAVTGKYKKDGSQNINVSLRLTPVRVVNEEVEQAGDEHAKAILIGGVEQMDATALEAFSKIKEALQSYIITKGL